jgi:hypothetical protein
MTNGNYPPANEQVEPRDVWLMAGGDSEEFDKGIFDYLLVKYGLADAKGPEATDLARLSDEQLVHLATNCANQAIYSGFCEPANKLFVNEAGQVLFALDSRVDNPAIVELIDVLAEVGADEDHFMHEKAISTIRECLAKINEPA